MSHASHLWNNIHGKINLCSNSEVCNNEVQYVSSDKN